jgi:uncharacterized protein YndB with AHSA1/START domain
MAIHRIDVHAVSPAPPEAVWARLADATTWPEWSGFEAAVIEQPDPTGGQGVGSRRRFTFGRTRSLEEIVAFEPPRHVAYVLLSGLPVRDYRGDVELTRTADGGTAIHWHSEFVPKIPGTGKLVVRKLGAFIDDLARALAAAAARADDQA